MFFFFSSRRRHTRWPRDWSSDVCSSDLFRGKTIHKYCHFFLFESKHGEPVPQTEEGITDCAWYSADEARRTISYDNAREVLAQATAMVQALTQVEDGPVGGGSG